MRIYHDSRDLAYRSPYGAVIAGGTVSLSLDVDREDVEECVCRLWSDIDGETLVPMAPSETEDDAYTCDILLKEPGIIWYSFIVKLSDGTQVRYGAQEGHTGGEGQEYDHEPPSFQITV